MSQKIDIGQKRKVAFVCSGGGSKAGAFHLGVALALKEHGFSFLGGPAASQSHLAPKNLEISTYVGSSAGSIICSYLAAGYTLDNIFCSFLGKDPTHPEDRLPKILPAMTYQMMFKLRPGLAKEQLSQLTNVKAVIGDLLEGNWKGLLNPRWLKATGLFSTDGLEEFLREEVLPSNSFKDYAADLFIVATQLNHSRKVIFGKYHYEPPPHDLTCQYGNNVSISQACAASAALPFIFSPYLINDSEGNPVHYIDGEIRDTLSTHVAVDSGADLVIASHTHTPYHMSPEIGSLTERGLPDIVIQSIYLLIEQKINNHIHNKKIQRSAIESVSKFCKEQNVDDDLRKRICGILESELNHRLDVDTIYISPSPEDHHLFFTEHFSLSPKKLAEIVRSGFKAAADTLRNYQFTKPS